MTTELDNCGTEVHQEDQKIIFRNTITIFQNSGLFSLSNAILLSFECHYDNTVDVTDTITVHDVVGKGYDSSSGEFEFNLVKYVSEDFNQRVPEGDVIRVGEEIFFAVEAPKLPLNVNFMVKECTVVNAEHNQSFKFIVNGEANEMVRAEFLNSLPYDQNNPAKIKFTAFRFDLGDNYSAMTEEIICAAVVCDKSDDNSICNSQ